MLDIEVKTIPEDQHRYPPTWGDYYYEGNKLIFRISERENSDAERMIFLHEFLEQWITEKRGISEESISKFDIEFEKNWKEGEPDDPGYAENSPYKKEHRFAENIERLIAHEISLDFEIYNKGT